MTDIRLPRVLAAAVAGAELGLCGAALQALTRNLLAEPGILGVSAAATLGATATLYFGIAAVHPRARLLPSAWLGALLLVLADLLVRLLRTDNELRLGVVAALTGAPIFMAIVLRRGKARA